MVAVSVIVPVVDDLEQVMNLVRSLDRQTLPSDDFEVVLHGADGRAGLDELDALAAHRSNVKVVRSTDRARNLLAAAEGDFVLMVDHDETLFPGALARLHHFAQQHGVDAVIARAVAPGMSAPAELWTDAALLENAHIVPARISPADLAGGQLFVRRDLAKLTDNLSLETTSTRVGVLGSHAITLRAGQQAGPPAAQTGPVGPAATVESADWRDGSLHLLLRTVGPGPASGKGRAVLQLAHADTQETFLLPADILPARVPDESPSEGSPGGSELLVQAAIAPTRTPAEGQQLAAGSWHLSVVLAAGAETLPPTPIRWSPCPPALIGSIAVVPAPTTTANGPQLLTLDVGPMHHPLLTNLEPAAGMVIESVAGSKLVLNLPQLEVFGTDGIDGFIALDKMRLPARIRVRNGRAQLVAIVSGLAGTPVLSAQFGPGPLRTTGLSLQITGIGAMSLIKTPSASTPGAKDKASNTADSGRTKPSKKVEPPRTGLVADLRRAVPAPLEPAVKRLASIPTARRLYQRMTR